MHWLVAIARGVLAGAFAFSAAAKLRDRAGTRRALEGLGLAPGLDLTLAVVEGFTALGLLAERRTPAAAWVALGLLGAFTAFLGLRLSQGSHAPCPCFGTARPTPIGARTIVRNVVLMAVAVVATGSAAGAAPLIWLSAAVTGAVVGWAARRGGASRSGSAR